MKFNVEIHTTKESIIQVLKKITKTELKNFFFWVMKAALLSRWENNFQCQLTSFYYDRQRNIYSQEYI